MPPVKLLALCGSLRQASRSRVLLEATGLLCSPTTEFVLLESLGDLPLFNPDLEASAPAPVQRLWDAVTWADAVLIASPEYAHGMTGTIKNALDWLVGHIPFAYKPVAVFNPSHRATHADEALQETLRTMAAQLIPEACVRIPVTASALGAEALVHDAECGPLIRAALQAIEGHMRTTPLSAAP